MPNAIQQNLRFEQVFVDVLLLIGLLQPTSIAIDYTDENVFWADIGSQSLGVASLGALPKANPHLIFGANIISPVSVSINAIDR